MEVCFLEVLQLQMGCTYLSDLRYLPDTERIQLARKLMEVCPEAATLHEWNDALQYLARQPPNRRPPPQRSG